MVTYHVDGGGRRYVEEGVRAGGARVRCEESRGSLTRNVRNLGCALHCAPFAAGTSGRKRGLAVHLET